MHEIFAAERAALITQRNEGEISAEVIARVMRELVAALDESRLEICDRSFVRRVSGFGLPALRARSSATWQRR